MSTAKSGMTDDKQSKPCPDPNHKPPMHLHIPQGKKYVHVCPTCGNKIEIKATNITF